MILRETRRPAPPLRGTTMENSLGLYLHIPFCRSKCDYCDFYSLAGQDDRMDDYQRALLQQIPYGRTTTYKALADRLAAERGRMSAQAVGGAVGRNPISIIVPCHRVVGVDGGLTGYAGGVDRKARLLQLEGAEPSRLAAPTDA